VLSAFRTFFLTCSLGLALIATAATAATPPQGASVGIAAVVNEDIITYADIENRLRLYLLGAPAQPPEEIRKRLVDQVFTRLVDESLQMQEARNLGITVDPSEIEHAFGTVAGQNNTTSDIFRQRLKSAGVSPVTMEDQIRSEIAWSQVVRRKLRPQITISEAEIDTEIARLARSSGKTEFRVAEIYVSLKGAASEKAALEKLNSIAEEIRKGRPFSQLARQFSEAPGAATGGDLGWIEDGILDSRLNTALKAMKPGDLSAPIRTDGGFHLLFLRDSRQVETIAAKGAPAAKPTAPVAPTPADKEAATDAKRPSLVTTSTAPPETAPQGNLPATLKLKRLVLPIAANEPQVITQTKLARAESLRREITSCADMDTAMQSFTTDGTGDMGNVTIGELPKAMQSALADLPAEQLSTPVRDEKNITLLMICDPAGLRDTPTAALPIVNDGKAETAADTPAPDTAAAATGGAGPTLPASPVLTAAERQREEIANRLGVQRLEQMAERYLRDLRATAYIDKRF
jgi:peptidyl-prolyl cis-trans isomerase SurA